MKNYITLIVFFALFLVGCAAMPEDTPTAPNTPTVTKAAFSATDTPAPGKTVTPIPTETEAPTPSPAPTETATPTPTPDRFAPAIDTYGYAVNDIIEFFCDVALHSEYGDADGASIPLRRWSSPIQCYIAGTPTDADRTMLTTLFEEMNRTIGFPGIREATSETDANLVIHFLGGDEYNTLAADHVNELSDGFVTCWYDTVTNLYNEGVIAICLDPEQNIRNSVILEELMQSTGLFNDSYLHDDSIFYQDFNAPQWPTELDFIIFRLLYHPALSPGMTAEECAELIPHILQETN